MLLGAATWIACADTDTGRYSGPILDMHAHAFPADFQGPPPVALCSPFTPVLSGPVGVPWAEHFGKQLKEPACEDPLWSAPDDETLLRASLAAFERYNVYAVASGPLEHVRRWRGASPERILPALAFTVGSDPYTPEDVATLYREGEIAVFGEVLNQYAGVAADDARFAPYWDAAAEHDIPVAIHIGTGPPGAPYLGYPHYRAQLHSPLALDEVLAARPGLRVYIMHAGWPMLDDLLALLYAHPQVYVDVGVIAWGLPPAEFYRYLERIFDAGFGKRVLYGSDQMVWPDAIARSIEVVQGAAFLDAEEKADLFYRNAARFLKLSEEEVARHHAASR